MQIHHVLTDWVDRWVLDDHSGPIKRRELAMQPSDIGRIAVPAGPFPSTPDGGSFDLQPDGTFHVPEDVGAHFLSQPGWSTGLSPFPPKELAPENKEEPPAPSGSPGDDDKGDEKKDDDADKGTSPPKTPPAK